MIESESVIIDNILKYLDSKNLNIKFKKKTDVYVDCEYIKYNSKFNFSFYLVDNYCEGNVIDHNVKYYSNLPLNGIKQRSTKAVKKNYNKVYNNIMWMLKKYDESALEFKTKNDTKNKYCSELESHYNKKHSTICINVNFTSPEFTKITIDGYDVDVTTTYNILYKDNRYYLQSKNIKYDKM